MEAWSTKSLCQVLEQDEGVNGTFAILGCESIDCKTQGLADMESVRGPIDGALAPRVFVIRLRFKGGFA